MIVCRSFGILLTAYPTGSGGGTGGIEEFVLDILATVLTLCIRIVAGSTVGILMIYLRLGSLNVLGADLTGVCGNTVGLASGKGQAGSGVDGIFGLYKSVGELVARVVIGVTLMSYRIKNKLGLGFIAAKITLLAGGKTGSRASGGNTVNTDLVSLMLYSGNYGEAGLLVTAARASDALGMTGLGTGSSLLRYGNVVVTKRGSGVGVATYSTLGVLCTGGCRPSVLGNLALYKTASCTSLGSTSKTACLRPIVSESALPIGRRKATNRALLTGGTGCHGSLVCKGCALFNSACLTSLGGLTGSLGPLFMLTFFAASSKGNQKEY